MALLRTEGVSKAFGGVQALSDCSIEIEQGSIAGLIGPNGSGKTTLFNMITGYGRVDGGDIYLNDAKITNLAPDKVFALGIGRTFQLTRVFSRLTVMENMIVAAHHKERAGQQVQPDGGKRGTALGQIPRRVGNGGVSTARGDLAHIVHAPQRSRVQRGRRPTSGPRTRALFKGDKFSGAVQVGARLDVVDAEERVGQRAPLRNTWFGVAWCRTNLICHVYLPLVSAAPREGRSRVSSWYGTGMRVQVIRDRRFWIPPRNSSFPSPQIC